MAGKTLYDKLWDAHVVRTQDDGTCLLYIDRHLVHEVTSPQAFEGLRIAGRKPWRTDTVLATPDHNVPTTERSGGIAGIEDPISRTQVETLDANYTVFVHLSGPDEQIWGQHDGQPVESTFPTAEWVPGQIVVDQHQVEISAQAPDGTYKLLTGLYDSTTGQRLAVSGAADVLTDDRISLTLLEVARPDGEGNNQDP